jgi:hypothetical protein
MRACDSFTELEEEQLFNSIERHFGSVRNQAEEFLVSRCLTLNYMIVNLQSHLGVSF